MAAYKHSGVGREVTLRDSGNDRAEAHLLASHLTGTHLPSILSVRNVVKDYTSEGVPVRALDGVSLEVESGELVALVGRSGCAEVDPAKHGRRDGLSNFGGGVDRGCYNVDSRRFRTHAAQADANRFCLSVISAHAYADRCRERRNFPLMLAGESAGVRQRALASLRDAGVEEFASRMPYQLWAGRCSA